MGILTGWGERNKIPSSAFDASDDAVILWILQQGRETGVTTKSISYQCKSKGLSIPRVNQALSRLEGKGWAVWRASDSLRKKAPPGSLGVLFTLKRKPREIVKDFSAPCGQTRVSWWASGANNVTRVCKDGRDCVKIGS